MDFRGGGIDELGGEGTVYDVANTIHAHPTVSEIFMESGFAAFERPVHK